MAGTVGEPCVGGSVLPARGRIALFGCGFTAPERFARTRLDAAMFRFRGVAPMTVGSSPSCCFITSVVVLSSVFLNWGCGDLFFEL